VGGRRMYAWAWLQASLTARWVWLSRRSNAAVVSGSDVRTEIVAWRFRAGDAREQTAYDFGLSPAGVALRYEMPDAA
jgi:hypothetical protein